MRRRQYKHQRALTSTETIKMKITEGCIRNLIAKPFFGDVK